MKKLLGMSILLLATSLSVAMDSSVAMETESNMPQQQTLMSATNLAGTRKVTYDRADNHKVKAWNLETGEVRILGQIADPRIVSIRLKGFHLCFLDANGENLEKWPIEKDSNTSNILFIGKN